MKKTLAIVVATIVSVVAISFAIFKLVDYSNHYEIVVSVDYGNEQVRVFTLEAGQTALMPEVPEREGYKFVGFYKDKAMTKEFDFAEPIKHNTTIYIKWEKL